MEIDTDEDTDTDLDKKKNIVHRYGPQLGHRDKR
jgi:hypothetical protein